MKYKTLLTSLALTAMPAFAAPIYNIFELGIADGETAAYDQIGAENIYSSLANEPGTLAMYSVKSPENPQLAYMIEIYADNAAYQAHIQSPQYQKFREASPKILSDHKHKYNIEPQYLADKKIAQTAATRVNFATVTVKPEDNAALARIVKAEMAESLAKEADVLALYAATDKEQPQQWYFLEIYADDAAYQAHRETPHFQKYLQETAAMLQEKNIRTLTPTLLQNQGGVHYDAP